MSSGTRMGFCDAVIEEDYSGSAIGGQDQVLPGAPDGVFDLEAGAADMSNAAADAYSVGKLQLPAEAAIDVREDRAVIVVAVHAVQSETMQIIDSADSNQRKYTVLFTWPNMSMSAH